MSQDIRIAPVRSQDDLAAVAALFDAYAASLEVDLAYQGYGAERAGLPGQYGPPRGELLLARDADGTALGCVALRPLEGGVCEMKRLFVSSAARGTGLGAALAEAAVGTATRLGYAEIRLDTLPSMAAAIGLYERMGFGRTPPYYDGAPEGTIFLRKALKAG